MKLIRLFCTLAILAFSIQVAKSQTYWENQEDSLAKTLYTNKTDTINNKERWTFFLKESGYLGRLQVWFEKKETINAAFLDSQKIESKQALTLIIPSNYKVVQSGKEFFQIYLLNFSNKTLLIPRIDATLDSISEYIKVENKWLQVRKNGRSVCGNSYYKKQMASHEANLFKWASINQEAGTESLKYKLVFNYRGQEIESNEIEIKLFANQLKRFLEEGIKDNR